MVSRMCLLLLVVLSKGARWILEQPSSSLMPYHPRMQHAAIMARHSVFTWMGCFGAATRKATKLFDNPGWLPLLKRTMTKEVADRCSSEGVVSCTTGTDGQKKFKGLSGLKETQVYPHGYADELARQYRSEEEEFEGLVDSDSDSNYDSDCGDSWSDADLDEHDCCACRWSMRELG